MDTDTPTGEAHDAQPHMVMLVGNHVVGDSRVEKSAVSAARAGYRVTIVGVRHRSVFPMGRHGEIPIYRVETPFARHLAWVRTHLLEQEVDAQLDVLFGVADEPSKRQANAATADYVAGRGRLTKRIKWVRPLVREAARARRSARPIGRRTLARLTGKVQKLGGQLAAIRPGGWRDVWPQIADYEEAFLRVLVELKPDIIHVHDRHPMAGAASYAARMHAQGRHVPWVYDAHEWLPGQRFPGPANARIGWLAAEAELIQRADAVISVSPTLAHKMKRRHALAELPSVVVNAPVAEKTPMDPTVRLPLREECGLDGETPLLVYVGKLAEARGIFTMIDALPDMPGVHVAYVASRDPSVRAELRKRAAALSVGDRLHIVDYVPAESVTWYVESATIGMSPLYPTSAHHSAMPTKIREYLQAGLPIVASDLRAQGEFVREHGVGALHDPRNPSSLAGAVRQVLDNLDEYRLAIGEDLLQEHTWEREEKVLAEVWQALEPATAIIARPPLQVEEPEAEAALVRSPAAALFPESAQGLSEAWQAHAGDVIELGSLEGESQPLARALERWMRIDREADLVLFPVAGAVFGEYLGEAVTEARVLEAVGKQVGVFAGPANLVAGEALMRNNPLHPAHDWDAEFLGRNARQVRRVVAGLRELDVPVFTHSPIAAGRVRNAHWVPHVVRVEDSPRVPDERGPRVLVVPTSRSKAESEAMAELEVALEGHDVIVEQPRWRGFEASSATSADLVIDSLTLQELSEAGAWALGSGRVVIGSVPQIETESPVVEASSDSLVSTVLELLRGYGGPTWEELRHQSLAYGHSHLDGRKTVQIIRDAFPL